MNVPTIDLIVLSRDPSHLPPQVQAGIERQVGVRLNVHRISGTPLPQDTNRWETIARARNAGKQLGNSELLMFLDDDVVLEPDCVQKLYEHLSTETAYGAVASNYLREAIPATHDSHHVGMGATLFKRAVIRRIRFRWEVHRCECQCCCDDLRRQLHGIRYVSAASSIHLSGNEKQREHSSTGNLPAKPVIARQPKQRVLSHDRRGDFQPRPNRRGYVLAAFDRRHFSLFRGQFLASLRASGNFETVIVVGYGLEVSQKQFLLNEPGLRFISRPISDISPAIRRLVDFQDALRELEDETPVAYWDAGDCIFQTQLTELWPKVAAHPSKLLCCREPSDYPENPAVVDWTETIVDPACRQQVFQLLAENAWINAGFAAGTVSVMRDYLRETAAIRASSMLTGTRDWGDQTAMNIFLHTNPEFWEEIPSGWNYCLCRRSSKDYYVGRNGKLEAAHRKPIHVIHGNAGTLPAIDGIIYLRRRIRNLSNSFAGV